jgi:hypothetical protein
VTISNVEKGGRFQALVERALEAQYAQPFDTEVMLPIGSPPKLHAFDLVSRSRNVACECKAYTWTTGGNVPSAKVSNLREAANYLSLLEPDVLKILAVQPSRHPVNGESLVTYFSRLNGHLLGEHIQVIEVADDGRIHVVRGRLQIDS